MRGFGVEKDHSGWVELRFSTSGSYWLAAVENGETGKRQVRWPADGQCTLGLSFNDGPQVDYLAWETVHETVALWLIDALGIPDGKRRPRFAPGGPTAIRLDLGLALGALFHQITTTIERPRFVGAHAGDWYDAYRKAETDYKHQVTEIVQQWLPLPAAPDQATRATTR